VTNIGSDSATGNWRWQEDGRGTMSRVGFQYYASTSTSTGAMNGLLSAVVLPATATLVSDSTRVKYDSVGNVDTTWTARHLDGGTNDAIGAVGHRRELLRPRQR
jgi:hypothetical protein